MYTGVTRLTMRKKACLSPGDPGIQTGIDISVAGLLQAYEAPLNTGNGPAYLNFRD